MQFDWVWFFVGLGVVAIGVLILKYYNKIADATRLMTYTKWQLAGILTIVIGFLVALNVHVLLITSIVNLIIGR